MNCRNCYYFDGWIDDLHCECTKYPFLNIEESADAENCKHYTDMEEE